MSLAWAVKSATRATPPRKAAHGASPAMRDPTIRILTFSQQHEFPLQDGAGRGQYPQRRWLRGGRCRWWTGPRWCNAAPTTGSVRTSLSPGQPFLPEARAIDFRPPKDAPPGGTRRAQSRRCRSGYRGPHAGRARGRAGPTCRRAVYDEVAFIKVGDASTRWPTAARPARCRAPPCPLAVTRKTPGRPPNKQDPEQDPRYRRAFAARAGRRPRPFLGISFRAALSLLNLRIVGLMGGDVPGDEHRLRHHPRHAGRPGRR